MPNEASNTWRISGKKLGDSAMDPNPSIDITEDDQNIKMPDGSAGPYGIPVDAPLGVTLIKALWDKVRSATEVKELKAMLEGSFAITLDKGVLLKIISQSRCEGVRFYLGMKETEKQENVLTLVTVGVDATGKDLLYEYREGLQVADVPTRSLMAEYGHPPRIMATSGTEIDPFVLFKYSQ